jgi:NAD+ kinase
MKVAVTIKRDSQLARQVAERLLLFGEKELGVDMYVDIDVIDEIEWGKVYRPGIDRIDAVVVVGGDGTLFRFLQRLPDCDPPPIFTVKAGRKNFLMEVNPEESEKRFKDFIEGKYILEEYPRIVARIFGKHTRNPLALNDVVLSGWGAHTYKAIGLSLFVEEEKVYSFFGDGIIIATPLGSTAYALAAGGPIVDPSLNCVVVVPIAPMQFNVKPLVAPLTKRVRVSIDYGEAALVVDGQLADSLRAGEAVEVYGSICSVKLARFSRYSTYARLFTA